MQSGGPGYDEISQKALTTARLLKPQTLHKMVVILARSDPCGRNKHFTLTKSQAKQKTAGLYPLMAHIFVR